MPSRPLVAHRFDGTGGLCIPSDIAEFACWMFFASFTTSTNSTRRLVTSQLQPDKLPGFPVLQAFRDGFSHEGARFASRNTARQ